MQRNLRLLIVSTALTMAACGKSELGTVAQTAPSLAAPQNNGAELWGGARHGMTADQVLAISADIKPKTAPSSTLYSGAEQLLERNGISIAGAEFDAQYFFLDGKLEQITLALDPTGKIFSEAEFVANEVKDALTAKYGPPLNCKDFKGGISKGFSCNWARQDGNTRLFLNAIDETEPTLNIVYQAQLAKNASNL